MSGRPSAAWDSVGKAFTRGLMQLILTTSRDNGRAVMAAAYLNALVEPAIACAIAAVTEPQVPIASPVQAVFDEIPSNRTLLRPSRLTEELAGWAADLIHVGARVDSVPLEGIPTTEWDIADPTGRPADEIRAIRDAIRAQVEQYLHERSWLRATTA